MTDAPRTERPLRPGATNGSGATPSGPVVPERRRPTAPAAPRRARLTVRRVDPWSVLKFTFVFSIALLIVWVVAIGALYGVLKSMGVFDHVNSVLNDFTSKDGLPQYQITATTKQVVGWTAIVGAVNAVLFTALVTLGSFVYNLCSALSGGIEVTLTERRP